MTKDEQVQYLANIFHVARADGRVSTVEDSMVDELAKGVNAGYLETRNALDLSMEKDFTFTFPKRFSDRIRNLEDMLFVAYCESGLDDMEKKIIVDYAKQVGINQKQIDIIRKETKARLHKEAN